MVLVEIDAFPLAEKFEDAHHGGMRLALAALVVGDGVGMHAQPLRHLVLVEVELLACNQQLLRECQFRHKRSQITDDRLQMTGKNTEQLTTAICNLSSSSAARTLAAPRPPLAHTAPASPMCLWQYAPWRRAGPPCRDSRRSRGARRGRSCPASRPGRWR